MKWNKMLLPQPYLGVILGIYLSLGSLSHAQEKKYSAKFKSEIQQSCPGCQHLGNDSFLHLGSNDFHNAHVYFSRGEIDSAYVLISKISESKRKIDVKGQYILLTLKGIVLDEKRLYDDAVISLSKAIEIGTENQYPSAPNIYAILGQVYLEQREFQLGANWLEKWKASADLGSPEQPVNIHNLGLCYLHLKEYQRAEENLLLGYRLNDQFRDTLGLARSSLDIANLYYTQYKDSLAMPYFKKGLQFAKNANDLPILQNAYLNLAVVYENAKEYAKALGYRKEYEKIHDSIWNRDRIWQLAKKEKEIAVAAREEMLKAETERKNLYRIIGLILLSLLGIGSYFTYKIARQKKLITHLNQTKDKLFSILTHDLKTPIHLIKNKLFKVLSEGDNELRTSPKKWQSLNESYHLSKRTSLLMDNTLHWVLQNKGQLLFDPKQHELKAIIAQVLFDYHPVMTEKKVQFREELEPALYAYVDLNSIKTVLRNLLDNAIKFTNPGGQIILSTGMEDTCNCWVRIADNGQGFDTTTLQSNHRALNNSTPDTTGNTGTGLGLGLCKELVGKNNGQLNITSKIGNGTIVTMVLPRPKQEMK
ncbi:MAG: ATP-binding protein [Bacteroidota bacterium]